MTPKEYVKKFRHFIKDRLQGTTLLPSVVMAQAIYEAADDNGTIANSVLSKEYNNDMRIPANKSWKGPKVKLPVREIAKTKKPRRKAWFRIYSNAELSIGDRIKMLLHKVPAWPIAFLHEDTVKGQAAMLQLTDHSTDPNYGKRIVHIIMKHKLYWMDRQWLIEKAVRMAISISMFSVLSHALQHWDEWVPWRNM